MQLNYLTLKTTLKKLVIFFISILLFIFCEKGLAQNTEIDSLFTVLKTAKEDTNKVNTLNLLSYKFYHNAKGDRDTAIYYAKKALHLAQKLNFQKGMGMAHSRIGASYYLLGNFPETLKNYLEALKIFEAINDKREIAKINLSLSHFYWSRNAKVYAEGLKYDLAALKKYEEIGDKNETANMYCRIARSYKRVKNYPEAIKNYQMALKIREELNDKKEMAQIFMDIGLLFSEEKNYAESLKNYETAQKIYEEIGAKAKMSEIYSPIGRLHESQGNYTEAEKYFRMNIAAKREMGDTAFIWLTYLALGKIFDATNNEIEARKNFSEALIHTERNFIGILLLKDISSFLKYGNAAKVKEILLLKLESDKQQKLKANLPGTYLLLSKTDSALGNFMGAFENYKMSQLYRDSLYNEENTKKLTQSALEFEYDKKEALAKVAFEKRQDSLKLEQQKEIALQQLRFVYEQKQASAKTEQERQQLIFEEELKRQEIEADFKQQQTKARAEQERKEALVKAAQEKKDAVAEEEIQKQKLVRNGFIGGLMLVLVFASFIYNRFKVTQKQKIIIEQKEKETQHQNEIITEQKLLVEEKNREIVDSIEYALRIQTAILPPRKIVKQYLENSFILYKPKDIVAGDFYWMETVDDIVLFAACDCTGHGVPGAMVSVVCHNALNRAVREYGLTQPSLILDKTTEIVLENFSRSEEDIKDGMDISLCVFNTKTNTIQWAGANNPLWLIQDGELIETKADKQPIGMDENSKPFTNHTFTLNTNDTIFLFTDGYADQFGGETVQKKLTKKRFKELILSIQNNSIQDQELVLDRFITNYRKEIEQIDDILIIGVRV